MLVNTHILKLALAILTLFSIQAQAQVKTWTLQECLDTAMVQNKNVQMAKNQGEIALLKNKEAKAQLLPKLFIQGDYRYFTELPYQLMPQSAFGGPEGVFREIQFGVPHNISANLTFKMPLYDAQVMGGIKASQTYQELTFLQEGKTKEQVYLEVSNLYYNAQILKNKLAFIQQNLDNSRKLEKNTRLLYEQTIAQRTDWDKVLLQTQQLESAELQVESQYETVLKALKFVIGLPLSAVMDIPISIGFNESEDWSKQKTLDELIQEKQLQLKQQELTTLKNSRIPSLAIYGNYGRTGFGFTGDPESFLNFYPVSFLGVQLNMPLFNGSVTHKKISQKKMELENNQLQQDLIVEQTDMLHQNVLRQSHVAKSQLQTSQQQIQLAESVYQRTILQQQEGLASLTEVLLADNALRDAQQLYLNAMVEYLKANLDIKKTSGNLLN
ncbi:TolC family protein [Fontibacter flavus]|uniref:TolC family protein n=1 Tax=Fontibacter flavus TaxID=654838 RepID=A0ABV6FV14_9BACT